MTAFFLTFFYLFLIPLPLCKCSEQFELDIFDVIQCDEVLENTEITGFKVIRDEEEDTYISKDYSFDLEAQVQDALHCSPIAFTENEIEMEAEINVNNCFSTKLYGSYLYPRDYGKSRGDFMAEMLKRFRSESGWPLADSIDWKQVDRTKLPRKYAEIELNAREMRKNIKQYPEIADNIHFKPYTTDQLSLKALHQRKNKSRVPGNQNEWKTAYQRIFEIFRQETGRIYAENISWSKLDKSRLPEKYRDQEITSLSIYRGKLYEDPEFIENIHFTHDSDLKSKRKYENI